MGGRTMIHLELPYATSTLHCALGSVLEPHQATKRVRCVNRTAKELVDLAPYLGARLALSDAIMHCKSAEHGGSSTIRVARYEYTIRSPP